MTYLRYVSLPSYPTKVAKISYWLGSAGCLMVAAVGYAYCSLHGNGLTYDSRLYIEAALALQEGRVAYTHFPPGFPVFLSLISSAQAIILAQGLAYLAGLFLWLRLGHKLLNRGPFLWFAGCLAFSPVLLSIHYFLWSEGLFFLLFSALIYLQHKLYEKNGALYPFLWVALVSVAGALPLVRFIGLPLLLASSTFLVFMLTNARKSLSLYTVAAVVPSLCWLAWNGLQAGGGLEELRLLDPLHFSLSELSSWFIYSESNSLFFTLLFLLLAVYLLGLWWAGLWKKQVFVNYLLWLAIAYVAALCLSVYLAKVGYASDYLRYLSPLYPILFLFVAAFAQGWLPKRLPRLALALGLIAWLWMAYPISRYVRHVQRFHLRNKPESSQPQEPAPPVVVEVLATN